MKGRKFDPSIVAGVARRCAWGFPQVFICRPLSGMKPFPTLFWLSCPFLVQECALRESEGMVPVMEEYLEPLGDDWRMYNVRASLIRLSYISEWQRKLLYLHYPRIFRVLQKTFIGGISDIKRPTVKCLHLQVASWLSLSGHPGGPWLSEIFENTDCPDPSCRVCVRKGYP